MKKILIIPFIFLFSACFVSYNLPFVDTDETLKLRLGMTKKEVFELMGKPIYVKSGENNNHSVTIEWVYQVRALEITRYEKSVPKKRGEANHYSPPINNLILVFNNNNLVKWYTEGTSVGTTPAKSKLLNNILRAGLAALTLSIITNN